MMKAVWLTAIVLAAGQVAMSTEPAQRQRVSTVAGMPGLVAFWDFAHEQEGRWTSYYDPQTVDRGFPVSLRRIGDPVSYRPDQWPYQDEDSKLVYDSSGPLGRAVRFNQGYIFAEVARSDFDQSSLDVHGRQPFTLIAWTQFVGKRHLIAGIWDEGGWDKYGGWRQIALFGGLFGSRGVIGHISATGASSYPQSTIPGSQYARIRAIDGQAFDNHQWVALAMTFEPDQDRVTVYCDGVATPTRITDPVAQDVFRYEGPVASNPFHFPWPIFSPQALVLKFNGYHVETSGVYEHWLRVDTRAGTVVYDRSSPEGTTVSDRYRVNFDVWRGGQSLYAGRVVGQVSSQTRLETASVPMQPGDEIITSLEIRTGDDWTRVGSEIRYRIREGAPLTFGRALGLGSEPIEHGTQLYLDGVAVFDRVLSEVELRNLSFREPGAGN
jgi:hypothetical protein